MIYNNIYNNSFFKCTGKIHETKCVEIRTQWLVLSHIFIKGVVTGRTERYLVRGEGRRRVGRR